MAFSKQQNLNEWVQMLDALYGGSQNYSKTPYEIHAHLTEVCGVYARLRFKKKDKKRAEEFFQKYSLGLSL